MKTIAKWLMAGAAVIAFAGGVDAQAQRGGQRGGTAGGTRGQLPQGAMVGGGGGGTPSTLVINKAVQEEVKMTDEQKTKLEEWAKEATTKQREKMQTIPRDEMREKLPALLAEINKEQWKDIEGVLKSEQVTRVRQISVQAMGIRALSNKEVTDKLKLTEDQTSKIKGLVDDAQKETRELFGAGGTGVDREKMQENMKKVTELNKKTFEKAKESLTDDQKKTWTEMVGKDFDLTKLQGARPMRRDM